MYLPNWHKLKLLIPRYLLHIYSFNTVKTDSTAGPPPGRRDRLVHLRISRAGERTGVLNELGDVMTRSRSILNSWKWLITSALSPSGNVPRQRHLPMSERTRRRCEGLCSDTSGLLAASASRFHWSSQPQFIWLRGRFPNGTANASSRPTVCLHDVRQPDGQATRLVIAR